MTHHLVKFKLGDYRRMLAVEIFLGFGLFGPGGQHGYPMANGGWTGAVVNGGIKIPHETIHPGDSAIKMDRNFRFLGNLIF